MTTWQFWTLIAVLALCAVYIRQEISRQADRIVNAIRPPARMHENTPAEEAEYQARFKRAEP